MLKQRGRDMRGAARKEKPDGSFQAYNAKWMHKHHKRIMASLFNAHPFKVDERIVDDLLVRFRRCLRCCLPTYSHVHIVKK